MPLTFLGVDEASEKGGDKRKEYREVKQMRLRWMWTELWNENHNEIHLRHDSQGIDMCCVDTATEPCLNGRSVVARAG